MHDRHSPIREAQDPEGRPTEALFTRLHAIVWTPLPASHRRAAVSADKRMVVGHQGAALIGSNSRLPSRLIVSGGRSGTDYTLTARRPISVEPRLIAGHAMHSAHESGRNSERYYCPHNTRLMPPTKMRPTPCDTRSPKISQPVIGAAEQSYAAAFSVGSVTTVGGRFFRGTLLEAHERCTVGLLAIAARAHQRWDVSAPLDAFSPQIPRWSECYLAHLDTVSSDCVMSRST
jgi:hypothetical protein